MILEEPGSTHKWILPNPMDPVVVSIMEYFFNICIDSFW